MNSVVAAVQEEEFLPIEEAPGDLILTGPGRGLVEGDNVLLYPLLREMDDISHKSAGGDYERWANIQDSLVVPALDQFWFALVFLAEGHVLPMRDPADKRRISLIILKKLVRWWPDFCRLDDRFSHGIALPQNGYRWGRATWDLVRNLGMRDSWIHELQQIDPEDALERFIDLIVAENKRQGQASQ